MLVTDQVEMTSVWCEIKMGLLLFHKTFTDHKFKILRKMTDAVVHAVTKRCKRHLHVVFLTHFKCEQNCFLKSQPRVLEMITFIYLFISSSTIKI